MGYEGSIREEVLRKREIQAAAVLGDDRYEDVLTWSALSKERDGWMKRLSGGRSALLLRDRDAILGECSLARHSRVLIAAADDGLLLWEVLRCVPEGLAAGIVGTAAAKDALLRYAVTLDETEQPLLAVGNGLPSQEEVECAFACRTFEYILAHEPLKRLKGDMSTFAQSVRPLLAQGGKLVFLQSPPLLGERISRILQSECNAPCTLVEKLTVAEHTFFTGRTDLSWTVETAEDAFAKLHFLAHITTMEQKEERFLTPSDIGMWFNLQRSSWGVFIEHALGVDDFHTVERLLLERAKQGPVMWQWTSLLVTAHMLAD
jgi:putative ATPase